MRTWTRIVVLWGAFASLNAHAVEFSEEVLRVPWGYCVREKSTQPCSLEATLFLPPGPRPFPLVVLSHGSTGGPDPRPRWRPIEHVEWLTQRGWAVVVPMRRGHAGSEGEWAERFGDCGNANFIRPSVEASHDIKATLALLSTRSEIDSARVVLLGVSAGGFASLAAACSPGVVRVVNFAGGRGSLTRDRGATRSNCSPQALVAATQEFGRCGSVPTLWVYAANDKFFPPPLAQRMFDAFVATGGNGRFVLLPPFGDDGHSVTWKAAGISAWGKVVEPELQAALKHPGSSDLH